MKGYDFSGWATRNDLLCADGRTIRKDAFKGNDGQEVPLVWNHDHKNVDAVLGHALLENRDEGVYAYCKLNNTENANLVREYLTHGDLKSLSIFANNLKENAGNVIHGVIRELSVVLAPANPGATVDFVMAHGENGEESGLIADYDESTFVIYHSAESDEEGSKEDSKSGKEDDDKTFEDVLNGMSEEQQNVTYALMDDAYEQGKKDAGKEDSGEEEEGGKDPMKHNAFDPATQNGGAVLSHSAQMDILALAKNPSCGSLKNAIAYYAENNESELSHGAIDGEVMETLFPEYKDVRPGEPETLTDELAWVATVMNGVHKSPVSRIRTRQLDNRGRRNRAKGYKKGQYKEEGTDVALISRTTDPQTIFIKDKLNRDDIIDFTDFDMVNYQWKIMDGAMKEEIATAILIGDGREAGDEQKIYEEHVRSIWNDDELYTIHWDVDIDAEKAKLQGSDTAVYFGDNFVYAEAIIEAALNSRIKYKGSGNLKFLCTPHLVNMMLLARDRDGHRMYNSIADLKAALNVSSIETVEQFEGLVRTDKEGKNHELLGMFVNFADYHVGSAKGGEITRFEQFDIDFNQNKYLMETRMSGALTKVKSAIVLEKPVA